MNADTRRETLLAEFIATWEKLDGLRVNDSLDPLAEQFAVSKDVPSGVSHWCPVREATDPSKLESVYAQLPARFPPLFESLLLTYRWPEVDLRLYRLHANPLGADLSGEASSFL